MEAHLQEDPKGGNFVNKDSRAYKSREAFEDARLREAINKTATEKFRMFTRMMRITMMLNKARIIHKQE